MNPTPEPLPDVAARELHTWTPPDPDQRLLRDAYLDHLREHADGVWRSCRSGHLTASAIVVDPPRERVLLTLHPTVGRWLQTGGHCEPGDVSLADAALREATEESGLPGLRLEPVILRLDRHEVRCRAADGGSVALDHLDVQYLAIAESVTEERRSAESDDLRWWPWEAFPADPSVRRLVAAARAHLGR